MTRLPKLPRLIRLALRLAPLALLAGCGSQQSAAPAPVSRVGPQTILQAELQLHADPAGTLDKLRRLGVDRVRMFVPWAAIAPEPHSSTRPPGFDANDPAAYPAANWTTYDAIVRAAAARRVGLDFTLTGPPPLWATGRDAPQRAAHPQWKPSAPEFGAFVHAVGTRYSGHYRPAGASTALPRVDFWAIWNEPNYGPDLAPQAVQQSTIEVAPRLYRDLLDAAWTALHATGHGGDTVLIGELAPRGITVGNSPGNFSGMVPLRFLRALYCVDSGYHELQGDAAAVRGCPTGAGSSARFVASHPALFHAGGVSVHPYPQGLAPNIGTPDEPDYADLPALPQLESTLDGLQRAYGSSTRFPIYSNEFGYRTNPPEALLRSVAPAVAAFYLNWAEYLSWHNPRIRSYDQYLLVDPANGDFASGLEFSDRTPKATFYAFRMPIYMPITSGTSSDRLELWGCVRPARYARLDGRGRQLVQIEFKPVDAGSFRVLRTVRLGDPFGYFDVRQAFRSSGLVRLAWTYPDGTRIFSRTVSVTIR